MQAMQLAATANTEASREFYERKLGLRFVEDSPFALVFDVGGVMLRIQKVEKVVAPPYSSLGFIIDNMESTVTNLLENGVEFERYEFIQQDDQGIWTTPDGAKVAWCKDPDGSVVSFTQHPSR